MPADVRPLTRAFLAALAPLLLLTACAGSAPPMAPAPGLGTATPCAGINTPPPSYKGPVAPNSGPCPPTWTAGPQATGT
ncbi:MAG TPA: hypothetical protein VL974_12655, partial [Magnetospirillum sp.]|nr:hypothetical protein [Magnetospirillum sp.]